MLKYCRKDKGWHQIDSLPNRTDTYRRSFDFWLKSGGSAKLPKFSAGNVILRHVGEDQSIEDNWQGYIEHAAYRQPLASHQKIEGISVHRAFSKR